jgi:hypothetical protein
MGYRQFGPPYPSQSAFPARRIQVKCRQNAMLAPSDARLDASTGQAGLRPAAKCYLPS